MRHKLCLDVVSEAPPERAASTHVRRGNSLYGLQKKYNVDKINALRRVREVYALNGVEI